MLRHLASVVAALTLLMSASGCLIETNLDADGGGMVTATYQLKKGANVKDLKPQMQSPDVEVTDAKITDDSKGVFDLKVKDITKLSTAKFFNRSHITRTVDKEKGTTTVVAKVKNDKPKKVPDAIKKFYNDKVKIVTTAPGEITETNAKSKDGKTATWEYTMDEFFNVPEVEMKLTYKN